MAEFRRKRKDNLIALDRAKAIRMDLEKLEQQKKQSEDTRKEQERKSGVAAEAARPPSFKVMVSGDVVGNVDKLFNTVAAQAAKVGNFDVMLCVGAFLPDAICSSDGGFERSYLTGEKAVPVETFFVDSGAAMVHAAPQGTTLCPGVHFLGGYGVRDVRGLRVAFLSGRYDPAVYDAPAANTVDFIGGAFTSRAVAELRRIVAEDRKHRGIDILLTCGWPLDLEQKLPDDISFRPPELMDDRPWQQACAAPFAELCLALEPRYHLFGTADLFYQRPPFQAHKRGHVCRCIGLGRVGSTSKQRKWLHALSLSPMCLMKAEDLRQLPANATPCPFPVSALAAKVARKCAPPEAPVSSATGASEDALPQKALAALLRGDFAAFQGFAEQLKSKVVENGAAITKKAVERTLEPEIVPGNPSAHSEKALAVAGGDGAAPCGVTPSQSSIGLASTQAATLAATLLQETEGEQLTEEEREKKAAAKAWLSKGPEPGIVRFTFKNEGPLGLHLSKDVPPWILEVRDGSLAAKKAPRVPVGGIVVAVNGYELTEKDCQAAIQALKKRPVVLDVEWPEDQNKPLVNQA
eukprot:TRINITY_DN31510_c0_g4_i1.p1 TRINITY_DN31510_c0_g4~~TRINITY_DN31510_c0_g4_i1.p1  ORF type:complete len:604 (-),score=121.91 TRINITY_DN31510_c0_g4_i1:119-1852(-)